MPEKPVVVYFTFLLRDAADDDGCLWSMERIIIDFDRSPRDIRAVLAITPSVHIKAMAERYAKFDIMSGDVAIAGPARARNRVPIPVKQVIFDQ
jgi:hypothetical protein